MSYKEEIESIRQELIDLFIKDLQIVKELVLTCSTKEELLYKLFDKNLYKSEAYYYIKDMDFEEILSNLDLLLIGV